MKLPWSFFRARIASRFLFLFGSAVKRGSLETSRCATAAASTHEIITAKRVHLFNATVTSIGDGAPAMASASIHRSTSGTIDFGSSLIGLRSAGAFL